jgi:hypothetical protein
MSRDGFEPISYLINSSREQLHGFAGLAMILWITPAAGVTL